MRKAAGFTLLELLVTLTVAGILVGLAVPSFKTTILNGRLATESNDLLGAFLFARAQALTTGATNGSANQVQVCASNNTNTATPSCSGTNWASGWIVTGYVATPGASTAAPTATVFRIYPPIASGSTLTSPSSVSSVSFGLNGVTSTNGYFKLCDSRGASYARAIYLSATGEARVSPTAGKQLDGTTPITCP